MTLTGIRDQLIARLVDGFNHPEVPLFFEDTAGVDVDNLREDYFIRVQIDWTGAIPIGMGSRLTRKKRQYGRLSLLLFCREGQGDHQKTLYLDELDNLFGMQNLGGVITEAPSPSRPVEQGGWSSTTYSVPFFADIELTVN